MRRSHIAEFANRHGLQCLDRPKADAFAVSGYARVDSNQLILWVGSNVNTWLPIPANAIMHVEKVGCDVPADPGAAFVQIVIEPNAHGELFRKLVTEAPQQRKSDYAVRPLNVSPDFQTDTWSCGVHASFRIIRRWLNQNVSYAEMKERIGKHPDVIIDMWWGKVRMPFTNFEIGQSTDALAAEVHKHYYRNVSVERDASLDRIRELLDDSRPVMCLCQVGVGEVSVRIFGTRFKFLYPLLHWYVAINHASDIISLHDTDNDSVEDMPIPAFEARRAWNAGLFYPKAAEYLQKDGTSPRDIIVFA